MTDNPQYLFDVSRVFFANVLEPITIGPSDLCLRQYTVSVLAVEVPESIPNMCTPWQSPDGETYFLSSIKSKVRPLIHYKGTLAQERKVVEAFSHCHLYGISKQSLLQHISARILMSTYETRRDGMRRTVLNLLGVEYRSEDILKRYEDRKQEIRDVFEEEDDE